MGKKVIDRTPRSVQEVSDLIKDYLSNHYEMEKEEFSDSKSLRDEIGFDSLDTLDTLTWVDNKFGICIPDEVGYKVETVGDIIEITLAELRKDNRLKE